MHEYQFFESIIEKHLLSTFKNNVVQSHGVSIMFSPYLISIQNIH
jgi:hypothetical protein